MAKTYIKPDNNKHQYTCPHCNTLSQMQCGEHHFDSDQYRGFRNEIGYNNELTIHRCQCCGNKILWINNKYIYPDIIPEEANPDMPGTVKQFVQDEQPCYLQHEQHLKPVELFGVILSLLMPQYFY